MATEGGQKAVSHTESAVLRQLLDCFMAAAYGTAFESL